jgi:hypothetical protein
MGWAWRVGDGRNGLNVTIIGNSTGPAGPGCGYFGLGASFVGAPAPAWYGVAGFDNGVAGETACDRPAAGKRLPVPKPMDEPRLERGAGVSDRRCCGGVFLRLEWRVYCIEFRD